MTKNISSDNIIKYAKVSQVNSAKPRLPSIQNMYFTSTVIFKALRDSDNTPAPGAETLSINT